MMSLSSILVVIALAFLLASPISAAEDWESNPIVEAMNEPQVHRIRELRQVILDNGCDSNICFVMDGSEYVSDLEFEDQKNFVDLIVAITTTDEPGNYCASIYDSFFDPISTLTGEKERFLSIIRESKPKSFYKGKINLLPGLGYAIKQLRRQNRDANNVILFSKHDPGLVKVPFWFKQFVNRGDSISAVTFDTAIAPQLAEITGNINRVMPIDGFFEISETIVAVVADVCSTACTTFANSGKRRGPRRSIGRCPKRLGATRRFKNYKAGDGLAAPPPAPKKRPSKQ